MKKDWADWGLARGIERHNFLAVRLARKRIEQFSYHGRVIDLGCGRASYKEFMLQTADQYIGVDWKNSMHDQSKVDVYADFSKPLPFNDSCADTVTSFNVIEHLPDSNLFLSECNRILRPDGRLFLLAPFLWHIHERPYDFYRYTVYGLKYLLEKNGFKEIAINPQTGFWESWVLAFNYHTTRFAVGPLKYFFYIIWWITQMIAPLLDRIDCSADQHTHTSSYAVEARKCG